MPPSLERCVPLLTLSASAPSRPSSRSEARSK